MLGSMDTLPRGAAQIVALLATLAVPAAQAAAPMAGEAGSGSIPLLVVYVVVAIGFSFLCSVAEAVLLSMTASYIESQKADHPKRAQMLHRLRQENVDQSLAAILTLNTIAHTVGAVAAGAQAAAIFGSAWVGVFSGALTLGILFVSEIIPKTLGAVFWSTLVVPTAWFVRLLIIVLFPLVWISERLTRLISRERNMHVLSREELVAMASVGAESGQIQESESTIIQNLFRFDSLRVTDIMTPRTVMTALPETIDVREAWERLADTPFSRIPVYGEDTDDVTGFVLRNDILTRVARDEFDESLRDLRRDVLAVPVSVSLMTLFQRLLEKRQHMAIVVDEYGSTRGLVTLEDLVETLTGMEIMDETDDIEDMRVLARRHWERRARSLGMVRPDAPVGGEDTGPDES